MAASDLSVLVVSCDKYSDAWPLFFKLFRKYWANCPHPVYLGTNTLGAPDPGARTIRVGPDSSWASNLKEMLFSIDSRYVMLMLDDHFLLAPVPTATIGDLLDVMDRTGAGYLRLDPSPPPDAPLKGTAGIGVIAKDSPYRASLHVAVWRRDVLQRLLRPGESAWDMEFKGSLRSADFEEPFFAATRPVIRYDMEGIVRGAWTRRARKLAADEGIILDFTRRPLLDRKRTWLRRLANARARVIGLVPWRLRRSLLRKRIEKHLQLARPDGRSGGA